MPDVNIIMELLRLKIENPGLPVIVHVSDSIFWDAYEDADFFIGRLYHVKIGDYYLYNDKVYDDNQVLFERILDGWKFQIDDTHEKICADIESYIDGLSHKKVIYLYVEL